VAQLESPRVVWLMLPAGEVTEQHLQDLIPLLDPGDLVIDGGNAHYPDSVRRGELLAGHDLLFMDAGTSGGVWGLDNGYCLMVGGSEQALRLVRPALEVLGPRPRTGAGPMWVRWVPAISPR
jgi:6-phosphogluconate dehydrogenase